MPEAKHQEIPFTGSKKGGRSTSRHITISRSKKQMNYIDPVVENISLVKICNEFSSLGHLKRNTFLLPINKAMYT